ncbi:hypothetical protein GEMRC1_003191 [Eukaryota sp. GEM-RC1]
MWSNIDNLLESRKRTSSSSLPTKRPTHLSDTKSFLTKLSTSDWTNIPDCGDPLARELRNEGATIREHWTPVPDSLIVTGHNQLRSNIMVARIEGSTKVNSADDVDVSDYLQSLRKLSQDDTPQDEAFIGDAGKISSILDEVIRANPHSPSAWLSAVRAAVRAGSLKKARGLALQGVLRCPKSEELWVEVVELVKSVEEKKKMVKKGLNVLPESEQLWLRYIEIVEKGDRKEVIRRALDHVSKSIKLWRIYIDSLDLVEKSEGLREASLALEDQFIEFHAELLEVKLRLLSENRDLDITELSNLIDEFFLGKSEVDFGGRDGLTQFLIGYIKKLNEFDCFYSVIFIEKVRIFLNFDHNDFISFLSSQESLSEFSLTTTFFNVVSDPHHDQKWKELISTVAFSNIPERFRSIFLQLFNYFNVDPNPSSLPFALSLSNELLKKCFTFAFFFCPMSTKLVGTLVKILNFKNHLDQAASVCFEYFNNLDISNHLDSQDLLLLIDLFCKVIVQQKSIVALTEVCPIFETIINNPDVNHDSFVLLYVKVLISLNQRDQSIKLLANYSLEDSETLSVALF